MAGREVYETNWRFNESYKTAFETTDLTSIGFGWIHMGSLDLSDNTFIDDASFTSPVYGRTAVLVVDVLIGAAVPNPIVTVEYSDKDFATRAAGVQVTPGMQETTSISIPLPNGIDDVTNLSTNLLASGSISILGPSFYAEQFNTGDWSAASPGL